MVGLTLVAFGLPDNLMIAGAVEQTGGHPILLPKQGRLPFDSLEVFERCVMIAVAEMVRRYPFQDAGTGPRGAGPGDQGAVR